MIGPEIAMAASTVSTDSGAGADAACTPAAEAALGTAGVADFVSPQPTAKRTAANTTIPINLRMLFLHPLLPPKPEPYFFVYPNQWPPKKNITRGIPADPDFSTAFHPRANRSVGIRDGHAGVKNWRFMQQRRFRADHQHV